MVGHWGAMIRRPLAALLRTVALSRFAQELRWTFTWPMLWLQGVLINLFLAAFYTLFQRPDLGGHYDTLLLYCVYFSTFVLADVTTTNIFGVDIARTTAALRSESFLRVLMRKNAVQFVVVIVPVLVVTGVWTEYLYHESEMMRTLPGVLYPMVLFMAVGNLISVIFPVLQAPLSWHVRQWRLWRCHVPLLASYAIPYAIFAVWVVTDLPRVLFTMLRDLGSDSFVPPSETASALVVASAGIYALLTAVSVWLFSRRGFVFWWQRALVEATPVDEATRAALRQWRVTSLR